MKTANLRAATVLAVAATFGLTACGAGEASAPSSVDTQKMKDYAACMQKYGVNVPAPDEGEPPGGLFTINTSDPKVLAARTACARLAPAAHPQGQMDPAEEDRALKLAECLRTEGIKAKDPAPGSVEVVLEDGVTYTQQQLVDAYTTCNEQVRSAAE